MSSRKNLRPPARAAVLRAVHTALDDMKAVNIKTLDVRSATDAYDAMVIASGNSDRHVRSIADRVVQLCKASGVRPLGVEGERDGEWVLVDLNDVIVHVMLPRVREFYSLETLWDVPAVGADPKPKAKAKAKARAKSTAPAGKPVAPARKPAKKAAKKVARKAAKKVVRPRRPAAG